jgi:hypothetical protein
MPSVQVENHCWMDMAVATRGLLSLPWATTATLPLIPTDRLLPKRVHWEPKEATRHAVEDPQGPGRNDDVAAAEKPA